MAFRGSRRLHRTGLQARSSGVAFYFADDAFKRLEAVPQIIPLRELCRPYCEDISYYVSKTPAEIAFTQSQSKGERFRRIPSVVRQACPEPRRGGLTTNGLGMYSGVSHTGGSPQTTVTAASLRQGTETSIRPRMVPTRDRRRSPGRCAWRGPSPRAIRSDR